MSSIISIIIHKIIISCDRQAAIRRDRDYDGEGLAASHRFVPYLAGPQLLTGRRSIRYIASSRLYCGVTGVQNVPCISADRESETTESREYSNKETPLLRYSTVLSVSSDTIPKPASARVPSHPQRIPAQYPPAHCQLNRLYYADEMRRSTHRLCSTPVLSLCPAASEPPRWQRNHESGGL